MESMNTMRSIKEKKADVSAKSKPYLEEVGDFTAMGAVGLAGGLGEGHALSPRGCLVFAVVGGLLATEQVVRCDTKPVTQLCELARVGDGFIVLPAPDRAPNKIASIAAHALRELLLGKPGPLSRLREPGAEGALIHERSLIWFDRAVK
jgi:hypothetical protein